MLSLAQFLLLFALLATAWFVVLAPQRRRLQAHRRFVSELMVGDRVVTTAGTFGTVRVLTENTVELEIAADVVITVARPAIGRMQTDVTGAAGHDETIERRDAAASDRRLDADGME